jgi:uncharacterized metal-binding protein/predicted Fe-Mo cluster-binding NifX family protein
MRFAIPILGERIAPRYTIARTALLVTLSRNRLTSQIVVPIRITARVDLSEFLAQYQIDTLVCGGISKSDKESLLARDISIIDNVACSIDQIIEAIQTGRLRPGYGFESSYSPDSTGSGMPDPDHDTRQSVGDNDRKKSDNEALSSFDCLACRDKICLRGRKCNPALLGPGAEIDEDVQSILESAMDITLERERKLCRLAELVYFCLEMNYHRIGLAFCVDLTEPTEILAPVLRRFFDVFPVCCKMGGKHATNPIADIGATVKTPEFEQIACNPLGQAEILNRMETDLNIIVGLCVGVDCLFAKASHAPVTTLFIKDKSLANNPIGALYSDYYLREATRSPTTSI